MFTFPVLKVKREIKRHIIVTFCIMVLLCVPFCISMLCNAAEQLNNVLIKDTDLYVLVYGDTQVIQNSIKESLTEKDFFEKSVRFLRFVSDMIEKNNIEEHYVRISDRGVLFLTVNDDREQSIYTKNYYDMRFEEFQEAYADFFQHYETETLETIASRQKLYFDIYGLNIGCYSANAANDGLNIIEGETFSENVNDMVCLISDESIYLVNKDSEKPLSIGDSISVKLRAETDEGIVCGDIYDFQIIGKYRAEKKADTQIWPNTDYDMIISTGAFTKMISEADRLFCNNNVEETRMYFPYYIFPAVFKVNSLEQLRGTVRTIQQEYPEYEFYSNTEDYAVMLSITESLMNTFTLVKMLFYGVITAGLLTIVYLNVHREAKSIAIRSALGQKNEVTIIQTVLITLSSYVISGIVGYLAAKLITSVTINEILTFSLRNSETVISDIVNIEPQNMVFHLSIRLKDLTILVVLMVISIIFETILIKHTLEKRNVREILQEGAV